MSRRVRIAWGSSPGALAGEVERYWAGVETRLEREMIAAGRTILTYAKSSHPWVNRTGEAEAKLEVTVTNHGDTIELALWHGAPHGRWLEYRWGGRWGVIPAALTMGYPHVMRAALNALRG